MANLKKVGAHRRRAFTDVGVGMGGELRLQKLKYAAGIDCSPFVDYNCRMQRNSPRSSTLHYIFTLFLHSGHD